MFRFNSLKKWFRGSARPVRPIETRRFRPLLETLESRLTPSNVSATVMGGNLNITDPAAMSSLTLSQTAANQVIITPDAGTTINGKAGPATFTSVTGGLNVNLEGGKDSLTFDLSKHSFTIGNVSITGTTGNKTVLTNAAGTTNTLNVNGSYLEALGNGFDFTQLHQFDVTGNMKFDHAAGNNLVFLGVDKSNLGMMFNKVGGSLSAQDISAGGMVGTGFDVDALEETNVAGNITALLGTGNGGWSTVGSLSSNSITVGGNVSIIGKSGFLAFGDFANDGEEVVNAHVGGTVTMNLGSGPFNTALFGNPASPSSTSAGKVVITGTGAHDTAIINPSTIHHNLGVFLTGASSTTSIDDTSVGGSTALVLTGGSSSIAIDNNSIGSTFSGMVDVLMMGSNNMLAINSHSGGSPGVTTFKGPVIADLGASNNVLILAEAGMVDFQTGSLFIGGSGNDNLAIVNHDNITGVQPMLVNFS
jgi:hypothetical protein